jgi:hypothetical protein
MSRRCDEADCHKWAFSGTKYCLFHKDLALKRSSKSLTDAIEIEKLEIQERCGEATANQVIQRQRESLVGSLSVSEREKGTVVQQSAKGISWTKDVLPQWQREERPCAYDWSLVTYCEDRIYAGQHPLNHMRQAISIEGIVKLLHILCWDSYDIGQRQEPLFYRPNTDLSWNIGPPNGYDLCEIVIPAYLKKIGLVHLSLVEAIKEGSVEELRDLQPEVGDGDCFFSHVQSKALGFTVQTLECGGGVLGRAA